MADHRRSDRIAWLSLGAVIGVFLGVVFAGIGVLFFLRSGIKVKQDLRTAQAITRNILNLSFEDKDDVYVLKPAEFTTTEISGDYASDGNHSLLVKMRAKESFPGISWVSQGGEALDFSQAKGFGFDVYNPTDYYVKLEIKFKSDFEQKEEVRSFNVTLKPYEWNKIFIPTLQLAEICDSRRISYIKIFPTFPPQDMILYFDNFKAE